MQDLTTISGMIGSGWGESNPTLPALSLDEYDNNDPAVQIVIENMGSDEVFLIDTIYKKTQTVRVTVFLKPIYNEPGYIDTAKTTFYNALAEIDRILESGRYSGSTTYNRGRWNEISIPHGRTEIPAGEPIPSFFASQDILIEGY